MRLQSVPPVRVAIGRARAIAGDWRKTADSLRTGPMRRLAELLARCAEAFAVQMAREIGKPVGFGRIEVQRSAEMLRAVTARFETTPAADESGPALVRRRPHGVVAVITPWNNPIYLPLGKIVPAVLYGNTVVWKPAPEAKAVSGYLLDTLREAGCPDGLVNLLEGGPREAETLMSDPSIAAVTITGSLTAGNRARAICAERRIPLQAELGGNNAAVVWPDADLGEVAGAVAAGAFDLAGQRCTANRRVIVHESCRDRFLPLLLRESAELRWGDPLSADTRIGPLVSTAHRDRVAAVVGRAAAACGPGLLPHGSSVPGEGAWYPPTILLCDDPEQEIVQEETFGPVLVVQTARDWDHAMRLCNGVRQGLAAAVFTSSQTIADRFLDEAEAGILKVNQSTADAAVDVPFCGWKASGMGPPEHGVFDVEFYTCPQTVYRSGSGKLRV
jgi:acyl-CoA reductase-like NAD-dependent aldehyde dehydrogenase